jgi:hypothetical protein
MVNLKMKIYKFFKYDADKNEYKFPLYKGKTF